MKLRNAKLISRLQSDTGANIYLVLSFLELLADQLTQRAQRICTIESCELPDNQR